MRRGLVRAVLATAVFLGAAASARADAVVLAAGDFGDCSAEARQGPYRTANVLAGQAATILALGDLAYDGGTPAEFADCYDPTWGRFEDRSRPVPGNHEYRTPGASGYFGYWGSRAGPSSKGYYSFDLGDWHVVAINSELNIGATSPQVAWLKGDLVASTKRCKLAFLHRPRWSSGSHGSSAALSAVYKVLYDNRVTLLFAGHDHDYERFAPLNPSGAVETGRGVREFVVGTGGAPLRGFATIRGGSQARNASSKGVLKLTLGATGYAWEFLPVAGATYGDTGRGTCVPAA
jgi:hypothetical protein